MRAPSVFFFGQWRARGDDIGGAGGVAGRSGAGAGAGDLAEAGDQTGRPVARQRGRRALGPVRRVGARGRGRDHRDGEGGDVIKLQVATRKTDVAAKISLMLFSF